MRRMARAAIAAALLCACAWVTAAGDPAPETCASPGEALTRGVLAFADTLDASEDTDWAFGGSGSRQAEQAAQKERRGFLARIPAGGATKGGGDGVVMCAGGKYLLLQAYAALVSLRATGCALPVQIWYSMRVDGSVPRAAREKLEALGNVSFVDLDATVADKRAQLVLRERGTVQGKFYALKVLALAATTFERVLLLDADNHAVRDPSELFRSEAFLRNGAIFWPDIWVAARAMTMNGDEGLSVVPAFELEDDGDRATVDSGQLMVDKGRHWECVMLALYIVLRGDKYYPILDGLYGMGSVGDKQAFPVAWKSLRHPYTQVAVAPAAAGHMAKKPNTNYATHLQHDPRFCGISMVQHSPEGDEARVMFVHRNINKWTAGHGMRDEDMEDVEAAGMAKEETWRTWTHVLRWESRRAVEFVDGPASAFLNSAHHMDSGHACVQYQGPTTLTPFAEYLRGGGSAGAGAGASLVEPRDLERMSRAAVHAFGS